MTGFPAPQRARAKTSELSEMFRSSHSSRHAAKDACSVAPVVGVPNPQPEEKHKSRRSMLPFLGRRKTERQSASSSALPKKSTNTPLGSPGKESNLLTVASTTDWSSSDRPLLSTLPPLNVSPPSLGSKFAAHFTPLRSPTKTLKARHSSSQKSANTIPPTHSSTMLSPFSFDDRGPSLESRGSSIQSRSTTPRPLRQPLAENSPRYEVEEDFSDLFIPPKQTKSAQKASNLSPVIVKAADNGSKKSTEFGPVSPLTPASPTPPSTPRLQFPIPPSGFGLISSSGEKSFSDRSQELSRKVTSTPSSKHSDSSLKLPASSPQRSSISHEHSHNRGAIVGARDRNRAFSLSGSDTDASRATDSSVCSRRVKHQSAFPKTSALKRPAPPQRALSSSEKLSSGPPPSVPLPSPPPSVPLIIGQSIGSLPTITSVDSVPSHSYGHSTSRPRAKTLSAATGLSSSKLAAWMAPKPISQDKNTNADIPPSASMDELRDALALQSRKYTQLQEYAVTITKKFEDEKTSMAKTIQMLEREVRKKVREIEGLRWLVIHNGGADDIDAAANLARASLVTLDDGDRVDTFRAMDTARGLASSQSTTNPSGISVERDAGSVALSLRSHRRLGPDSLDHPGPPAVSLTLPSPEFGTTTSRSSLSLPMQTPSTPSSLSVIPEQPLDKGEISRAERQKAKEERRAARALHRISSSSVSSAACAAPIVSPPLPNDPTFDPQHSMDNVLKKLRPFRNT